MNPFLKKYWSQFQRAYNFECGFSDLREIENGLINDTFYLKDQSQEWILQKINQTAFADPKLVIKNFEVVSNHLANNADFPLQNLVVKKANDNQTFLYINNQYWRVTQYITNSIAHSKVSNLEQAFNGAKAIAEFDMALADLDYHAIKITINDFHHLNKRLKQFNQALKTDLNNRVKNCADEIALIEQYKQLANWIPQAEKSKKIVKHITHNDTKFSNILFAKNSNQVQAVIDWDTIMPGYFIFDFGDMLRSFSAVKDEEKPQNSYIDWSILEAVTKGYLSSAKKLSAFEKQNLLTGAEIIIFMLGVRFLTDYLNGDKYFKTQYYNQNLKRAQVQFNLFKQLTIEHKNWCNKLNLI